MLTAFSVMVPKQALKRFKTSTAFPMMELSVKTHGRKLNQYFIGAKHETLAVVVFVLLINGCTSVAYVENGAVSGSQCKNTVKIDDSGLRAVSMCSGDSEEK